MHINSHRYTNIHIKFLEKPFPARCGDSHLQSQDLGIGDKRIAIDLRPAGAKDSERLSQKQSPFWVYVCVALLFVFYATPRLLDYA